MSGRRAMRGLRNLSIKWKLTLIIMAATTVALLLISGAFTAYESITFRQAMSHDISTLAEIIGNQSTAALTYNDQPTATEILATLSAKKNIVAAGIYKDGQLFARYPADAGEMLPPNPRPGKPRFEDDYLVFAHPILLNGETIGTIYLKSDSKQLHERLWRYAGIILLFMVASWAVTFLLSASLQKIISQPISHLAETARAVSKEKNYSVRAVKRSEDELGQLMDVFNEMLQQIQERDAALRQAHDRLEKRVEERTRDLQLEIAERQRAQEALQKQLASMSLLNQIAQAISERQDLSNILQAVLRQVEEGALVDLGGVFLLEPQSETLTVAAVRERSEGASAKSGIEPGMTLSLDEAGLARCRGGETVYIADTGKTDMEMTRWLAAAGMKSAVAAPMMLEGKLFGILLVARQVAESFVSAECEFFRVLSKHVALAAHQARLHTELETAYNELRQTQQAVMQQDRLRALGQMASGIAHDINNALSPVVGFAGLLLAYEPNLSLSAKKQLNYIKTAGEDVAHIVARLREFYRHRGERESLVLVKLNQTVGQVVDMTRPRWRDMPQEKGLHVELNTDLAADLPDIPGIPSEIREALTNLIL